MQRESLLLQKVGWRLPHIFRDSRRYWSSWIACKASRVSLSIHLAAADQQLSEDFRFESGPSLYSGLSLEGSPSQLKHVLQIVGKDGAALFTMIQSV